jgi:putative PIN family toxin of toxin-antitoxin system
MKELRRILTKKFRLPSEDVVLAMEPIYEAISRVIDHNLRLTNICRDADDDNVIACAVAAKANYLITGDADLLQVKACRGVKIITPRDFEALFV